MQVLAVFSFFRISFDRQNCLSNGKKKHLIDNFVYQMKFGFFKKPEICPKMRPKTLKNVQHNCLACHVSAAHDLSVAQDSVCKRAVQHTCACSVATAVMHELLPKQLAIKEEIMPRVDCYTI